MRDELTSFTRAFVKALRIEMDAMRQRLGPFEIPVEPGSALPASMATKAEGDASSPHYRFRALSPSDKLSAGVECSLRSSSGEELVTILEADGSDLALELQRPFSGAGPCSLVIYPWFLYEKLIAALEALPDSEDSFPESALAAFGKRPTHCATETEPPLLLDHMGLNDSQLAALRLCAENRVAFVWGPPGTGKTETLAQVCEELLARGKRLLLASTTNAAVDQALAKLARRESAAPLIESGAILRLGRTDAPSFGATPREAVQRLGSEARRRIAELDVEALRLRRRAKSALDLALRIEAAHAEQQRELFGDPPSADVSDAELGSVFEAAESDRFRATDARGRCELLHAAEVESLRLANELGVEIERLRDELSAAPAKLVSRCRMILSTLSGLVVNPLLASERFDVVIVEEAGMAILPAVFHCASLARESVLLVGDPRQLPPILQSSDPYARRAMGRSIFDVTVPEPEDSPAVALLDTQYRMHPDIGSLVSDLYYGGRIKNAAADRSAIAAARPAPGRALALVDSSGCGACRQAEGGYSRYNEGTAALCAEMAAALRRDGVGSIAIIAPYAEQARIIRKALASRRLEGVECSTVHRFQGNESDAVILDTVDGAPFAPGVLLAGSGPDSQAENLLNVSVSRARGKLVVIADLGYYLARASSSPIARLLGAMRERGVVLISDDALDSTR
jgi:Superfamily I DNA and RNA helicases and helicase subunits